MKLVSSNAFIFTLFFVFGFTLACATAKDAKESAAPGQSQHGRNAAEDSFCDEDDDCALVPADCCGCNQGGKQRAINKSSFAANAKKRKESCAGTMCIQVISKDPSCKARHASCQNGICSTAE